MGRRTNKATIATETPNRRSHQRIAGRPVEFHVKSSEWKNMPAKTRAALVEVVKCAARMQREKSGYKANFLWPYDEGSLQQAGYEFANGRTEAYRKVWWRILLLRARTPNAAAHRQPPGE